MPWFVNSILRTGISSVKSSADSLFSMKQEIPSRTSQEMAGIERVAAVSPLEVTSISMVPGVSLAAIIARRRPLNKRRLVPL